MMMNLTETPFEEVVLLNDDEETPIKLTGKKQVPILEVDGKIIVESLDIVDFIDKKVGGFLSSETNKNISVWLEDTKNYLYFLAFPRVIKQDLPEFKTQSAIDYFKSKKEASTKISFEEMLAKTSEYKEEAEYHLKLLSPLLKKLPSVKNRDFTKDDIILFPVLRLLSCVYGLKWDKNVQDYLKHISTITKIPLHKGI
jgi:glutaredoxin 2